ncbi:MAG: hypothetical protein GEU74_11350 [Nitriliruptorales bacterium]|nr:hypothetical protein [Nitriliruptorales bacterium]
MGTPAILMGDRITGACPIHQIPNPASGVPQPAPPMPFSAPLLQGLANKVLISNKPAAVVGSSGYNTPPHVGLHASDPFMIPTQQVGRITGASPTVMFEGKPAAKNAPPPMMCGTPGSIVGTGTTVLVA